MVLSDEKNVNVGDGGDLRNVFDAGGGLDLKGDDSVVVPVAGIAEQSGLVHAALREINGARSDRGIFGATYGLARLVGGVDGGDEATIGASIEGLLDAGPCVGAAHPNPG